MKKLAALFLAPVLCFGCFTIPEHYEPSGLYAEKNFKAPKELLLGFTDRGIAISEDFKPNRLENLFLYNLVGMKHGGGDFYPDTYFEVAPELGTESVPVVMFGYYNGGFVIGFDTNHDGRFDRGDEIERYRITEGKDIESGKLFPFSYYLLNLDTK